GPLADGGSADATAARIFALVELTTAIATVVRRAGIVYAAAGPVRESARERVPFQPAPELECAQRLPPSSLCYWSRGAEEGLGVYPELCRRYQVDGLREQDGRYASLAVVEERTALTGSRRR
ncbi:MAG TPA: hypothetical protein VFU47_10835, partial [Armatimonadota bacterium]|nr:hypothetical protein [Armatimonadota bacterium]